MNRLISAGKIQPVMSASYDLEQTGEAALLVHQNKAEGKLAVRCLAPSEGLGITNPEKRAAIGEEKISLLQRHARGEL
jgi:crotonyl-CoA reductase